MKHFGECSSILSLRTGGTKGPLGLCRGWGGGVPTAWVWSGGPDGRDGSEQRNGWRLSASRDKCAPACICCIIASSNKELHSHLQTCQASNYWLEVQFLAATPALGVERRGVCVMATRRKEGVGTGGESAGCAGRGTLLASQRTQAAGW